MDCSAIGPQVLSSASPLPQELISALVSTAAEAAISVFFNGSLRK